MDASQLSDSVNDSWYNRLADLLTKGVEVGTDLYKSKEGAQSAKAVANAQVASANASVMSSRNLIIAASVVAAAVVLWFVLRKK